MDSKRGASRKKSQGGKKSLHNEKSKVALYNALRHCEEKLEKNNFLTKKATPKISAVSKAMGDAMYDRIVDMLETSEIVVEKTLDFIDEVDESDSEEEQPRKKAKQNPKRIPLKDKVKAALAKSKPT